MRALKHFNKQPLKFSFEVYLCDLRGLPSDVGEVCVSWEKASNAKDSVVSRSTPTQTTGSKERTAMIDETLRLQATLYRGKRSDALDSKLTTIRVLDVSSGQYAPPTVLAQAEFDLAEHANLSAEAPAKSIKLSMPRTSLRRGDAAGDDMMLIQMTISSRWLQSTAEDYSTPSRSARRDPLASSASPHPNSLAVGIVPDGSGGAYSGGDVGGGGDAPLRSDASDGGLSSSLASDATTQEGTQQRGGGGSSSSSAGAASTFATLIGGGRAHRAEASRVAELSQLVAGAAADARQAETRLATLQFRLRSEVLESLEASLAAARSLKRGEEQGRAYDQLVVQLLDQVNRIAHDDGGFSRGGGGVAPLEAEVLQLRRELADSKVEVARLSNERDELAHVAKRLNKQLATVADLARRQSAA